MEYQLDIQGNKAFYESPGKDFTLIKGDSFSAMPDFDFRFDMIFADPPYFLSNGGISLQSGKVVCVNKGGMGQGEDTRGNDGVEHGVARTVQGQTEGKWVDMDFGNVSQHLLGG